MGHWMPPKQAIPTIYTAATRALEGKKNCESLIPEAQCCCASSLPAFHQESRMHSELQIQTGIHFRFDGEKAPPAAPVFSEDGDYKTKGEL
jgi:hypothetical protein